MYIYRRGHEHPRSGTWLSASSRTHLHYYSTSQYVTNQATRIVVKAAGDLAPQAIATVDDADTALADEAEADEGEKALTNEAQASEGSGLAETQVDIDAYRPTILPDRKWKLSEVDLGGLLQHLLPECPAES